MPGHGGPSRPSRPNWVVPAAILAVAALLVGVIVLTNGHKGTKTAAKGGGEIFLQPIASGGPDPFSASFAKGTPPSTVPPDKAVSLSANPPITAPPFPKASGPPETGGILTNTAIAANTPGLYGGTRDQSTCDKQAMIDFLNANPGKAAAWASAQGISVGDLGKYIDGLTPVLLRSDTRVTNHGFLNGKANPIQSVLEAGTAVLVDQFGTPRARCACGNPLKPPVPVSVLPAYQGPPWQGFSSTNITVINTSTTVINIFILVDVVTGQPFARQPGTPQGPDLPVPTLPGTGTGTGTGTGSTTTTVRGPTTTVGGAGDFVLADVQQRIDELPSAWTVDARGGTARIVLNADQGDYSWTVPERLNPAGTRIDYSGSSRGNISIDIGPRPADGIVYDTTDLLLHANANSSGRKSVVVTVPTAIREIKLVMAMGFGPVVTYTYRR